MNEGSVVFDEHGRPFLVVCPNCGKGNDEMWVSTGTCVNCGYVEPSREVEK